LKKLELRTLIVLVGMLAMQAPSYAQDLDSLELLEPDDAKLLIDEGLEKTTIDLSNLEEMDEIQSLKEDIDQSPGATQKVEVPGDVLNFKAAKKSEESSEAPISKMESIDPEMVIDESIKILNAEDAIASENSNSNKPQIFDIGNEEKNLLNLAKYVEGKIPDAEWDEIATKAQLDRYVIQQDDWLWKISQKLFGSGFYYSKIWSLNPQITNPHEIEPGMTLLFDTGSAEKMPDVKVGAFEENPLEEKKSAIGGEQLFDFKEFGDNTRPDWIEERKKLITEGTYFQYASEETYEDLASIGNQSLVREYEKYEPPIPDILIEEPNDQYDSTGFDKSSRISYQIKEGFFLNTFVTTNIIQDLGFVEAMKNEAVFVQKFDSIYVNFDESVRVKPGDLFSIYLPEGKVQNKISDREGYRYTIGGQIKAIRKINNLWECYVEDLTGLVQRKDRITVFTPKINKIIRTFNPRRIEAAIIDTYQNDSKGISFGDVVYLDRGRADGVEMGSVFQAYSFTDRGTEKRITIDPTYKVGELTVISLTDNFATALISQSSNEMTVGQLAFTKTEEDAARALRVKQQAVLGDVSKLEGKALDELDVELNLDKLSDDLLREADKVQLTEDELQELERQEREKSIIRDHERDLEELEKLEAELESSEKALNEAKVDEDKFLEQQNLDEVENKKKKDPNAFENLNEVEKEVGLKFMEEDLNSKDNPYGLTEFDLEEIDELLNTGQQ